MARDKNFCYPAEDVRALLAEVRELLKNAEYQDGYAQCLTQDCEALEVAANILETEDTCPQ